MNRLDSRTESSGIGYRAPGRKNPDHFTDYAYYSRLDQSTLHQLESQYHDTPGLDRPHFSNETLFGMAIGLMKLGVPGYRMRAVEYTLAAARLSSLPAQAIARRLIDAVPEASSKPEEAEVELWLYNGAKTGSLIAAGDLQTINPEVAQMARNDFVQNGGYNEFLSRAQFESDIASVNDLSSLRGWTDICENRPLHYAAAFGDAALLEQLLQQGAEVNATNQRGETALYMACLAGHAACVTQLAAFKADAGICSTAHGVSCLHWLFNFKRDDQLEVARLLVENGADPRRCTLLRKDQNFSVPIKWAHFPFHWPAGTPLHWSTFARSPSACDALLSFGANVDDLDGANDARAQTSLAMAAYRGDSIMIRHLLSRKADPNRLDGKGCSPAHMLAIDSFRMNRLFDMCLALKWWVYHGSWENHKTELAECVSALSLAGGSIDSRTRQISPSTSQTPILDAVEDANCGALLALLQAGASVTSARQYSEESLLHVWVGHNSQRLPYKDAFRAAVEALASHKDIISARDSRQRTILHSCVDAPWEEDFRYLSSRFIIVSGGLLEAVDESGWTPLLLAVRSKTSDDDDHQAVSRSEWLHEQGADLLAKDHDDCGLLYHACDNTQLTDEQCLRLIRRLLRPMTLTDRRSYIQTSRSKKALMTPLMCACDNSLAEVVALLTSLMGDINELSASNLTALDIAINRAQALRQRFLVLWLTDGIVKWDRKKQYFRAVQDRFKLEALQRQELLLNDEIAKEALFRRTFTESDLCEQATASSALKVD